MRVSRFFALAAIVAALGCGSSGTPTTSQQSTESATPPGPAEAPPQPRGEPVARITAVDLFNEYQQNVLAADKKYKGKVIEVSGWGVVKQGDDGRPHLGFEVIAFPGMTQAQLARLSPRERQWFRDGAYPPNVLAYLNSDGQTTAAGYKRGESIRAIGIVRGMQRADAWRDHVVVLEGCDLKPIDKPEPKKSSEDKGKK